MASGRSASVSATGEDLAVSTAEGVHSVGDPPRRCCAAQTRILGGVAVATHAKEFCNSVGWVWLFHESLRGVHLVMESDLCLCKEVCESLLAASRDSHLYP